MKKPKQSIGEIFQVVGDDFPSAGPAQQVKPMRIYTKAGNPDTPGNADHDAIVARFRGHLLGSFTPRNQ